MCCHFVGQLYPKAKSDIFGDHVFGLNGERTYPQYPGIVYVPEFDLQHGHVLPMDVGQSRDTAQPYERLVYLVYRLNEVFGSAHARGY